MSSALSISDKNISDALVEVMDSNNKTNWVLSKYDSTGKGLEFLGKGDKGLGEMITHLDDKEVVYGMYKIHAVDDDSKRTKFITVIWVGGSCKPMVRAKVTTHKSEVLKFFKGGHMELHVSSKEEIAKEDIVKKLNLVTGSHKPKAYDFGEGGDLVQAQ